MSAEENIIEQWMQGHIDDQTLRQYYPDIDLGQIRTILKHQAELQLVTTPAADVWQGVQTRTTYAAPPATAKRSRIWILGGIIMLALIAYLAWTMFRTDTSIQAAPATPQYIALSDQSEIQLSPGSIVRYARDFNRKVTLDGQAWFNVPQKGAFKVETPAGVIDVLGTQFDILAFDAQYMQVVCYEGRVSVKSRRGEERILAAGQSVLLNQQTFQAIQEHNDNRSSWLDGKQDYQGAPLSQVHDDLRRFYDVQLETNTNESIAFTGTIPTNDLEKALLYLTAATGLQYELDDTQKTITVQ